MKVERVIISGGGTGGHIFPALAIADEIRRRHPLADILFVGALGRMEMERVPAAGYRIIGLPVIGFPRKPGLKTIKFFVRLIKSNMQARRIINDFNPQLAVGVGGYASGPLLRAASLKKIPVLIQEQNSYAGITNKLLGKKAGAICVAYDHMDRFFPAQRIINTGNPVRANLLKQLVSKEEGAAHFGLDQDKKVILITGGSLGARSINNAMIEGLDQIAASDVQVIWQTGSFYYEDILKKLDNKMPPNLKVQQFITRMDLAYSVADVIISRAGAGTISELCLVGKPVILVPSPNVAEDHQTKNALALVERNAAIMIPDSQIGHRLLDEAVALISNEPKAAELSQMIKKLAKPDATKHIVDEAEKLLNV